MLWISQILLLAICHAIRGASIAFLTTSSLLPLNVATAPSELTEPGLPPAPIRKDYHDEDNQGYFYRFSPQPMTAHSPILRIYTMSPVIIEAIGYAFDEAAGDPYGRLKPLPGGPSGRAFFNFGVVIRIRPAPNVSELEVYAIKLCMEKLVLWAHQYSFGRSRFEYWVSEPGRGQYKKGVGEIFEPGPP